MTVKELLLRIGEPSNSTLDLYEDMQIEKFLKIYDKLNDKEQASIEKFVLCCRAFSVGESESKIVGKGETIRNWRAENGAKRKLPVVTDEELTQKHIEQMRQRVKDWNHPALSWTLGAHPEVIPESQDGYWKSNSYTRLSKQLFHGGNSTWREILETVPELVTQQEGLGLNSTSIKVLASWQDIIVDYIEKHPRMNDAISGGYTDVHEHVCAHTPVEVLLENHPELNPQNIAPRLLNILEGKRMYTINDLFSINVNDISAKKTKDFLLDIKQYIIEHLDDLDVAYHTYAYDATPHILPDLKIGKEYELYEKIQHAVQQLCTSWLAKSSSPKERRNIDIIEYYFVDNISVDQLASTCDMTQQSIRNIVNQFVVQFMDGVNSTLVKNYYVDPKLIDEIHTIAHDCLYRSSVDFWNCVAPSKSGEREVDNLVKSFFHIDFATPAQQDDAQFWDSRTCICIRDADKGKLVKQVLMPIYKFLQTKIKPVDVGAIQDVIRNSGHEVAMNTEYLRYVLENYSKVTTTTEGTYQLAIDAYTKAEYKCARYVYDHRDENREFLHTELENMLHIGKTQIVPSRLDDTLKEIVTLKEGKWKYRMNIK